ncbi:MAG: hypothetical protein U0136_06670 [Bdellovibrionota bacterium]
MHKVDIRRKIIVFKWVGLLCSLLVLAVAAFLAHDTKAPSVFDTAHEAGQASKSAFEGVNFGGSHKP